MELVERLKQQSLMLKTHEYFGGDLEAAGGTIAEAADLLEEALKEMVRYLPVIEAAERNPDIWETLTEGTGIATANGYRAILTKSQGEKIDG